MGISRTNHRPGMVLLVVLGMLTFFSILAATYLVFSSQSRQSSFVIAARNTSAPDTRALIDSALMTLIRGTDDPASPFYGEDLLSDYYGRFDSLRLVVTQPPNGFTHYLDSGLARFTVTNETGYPALPGNWDDLFTNRVITFRDGQLAGKSLRVLRSRYTVGPPAYHSLYIELPTELFAAGVVSDTAPPATREEQVRNLFQQNSRIHMNGLPRNSPGIGYDGSAIALNAPAQLAPAAGQGFSLARALQPNHLGRQTTKIAIDANGTPTSEQGDFDESYDAPDYFNWYLSYRDHQDRIIPSFHRPSVLNYILNESTFTGGFADPDNRRNAIVSLARATFRPLPIKGSTLASGTDLNTLFTGSNPTYGLRTPIDVTTGSSTAIEFRLNQLAKSLIGSADNWNPWDVDNDGDGIADSIWIDIDLPTIVSPEGKLLKPLVAPMIEDLSGRLNVNAHGNYEIPHNVATGGVGGRATWASTRQPFGAAAPMQLFRGIGYGPAEIVIPPVGNDTGLISTPSILTGLAGLRTDRYQFGARANVTTPPPGVAGYESLDLLRRGWRPPLHGLTVGYGYPMDVYGRAGIGLGRGGHLLMANSGLPAPALGGDESRDDPYEFDPSGKLAGDRHFTLEELEPVLRSHSFDLEFLPKRLRGHVQQLIEDHPEFARALTSLSSSDDSPRLAALDRITLFPPALSEAERLAAKQSVLYAVAALISGRPGTLNDAQIKQLVAPELRLGRKIDVNRPFGNGVDDNGNGVIDEPGENETQRAFALHPDLEVGGMSPPPGFENADPDYRHGLSNIEDAGIPPRQLLARHLYVLMMALTRDSEFPSFDPTVPLEDGSSQLYRARRIAQWAVNVVDYRDADSIMTRFVFDPEPFDGWGPLPEPPPEQYVVWGVEQPELLFSESLAFHDVRVRDTDRDSSGKRKMDEDELERDETTDQVRIPQGSLFLELYNPRSPVEPTGNDQRTKQAVPSELYSYANAPDTPDPSMLGLDLSRAAPDNVPVWRIAISAPHPDPTTIGGAANITAPPFDTDQQDPWKLRMDRPSTASFEPSQPDELVAENPIELDRFIWFGSYDDGALTALTNVVPDMEPEQVFFTPSAIATNQDAFLLPGQFLILAPRLRTHLGSVAFNGESPVRPSYQRFDVVDNEGLVHFREGETADLRLTPGVLGNGDPFAPAKPLIVGTHPPVGASWNSVFGTNFVGLNVSEPLPRSDSYYPRPTERYAGDSNAEYALEDSYIDFTDAATSSRDLPLDPTFGRIPVDNTNPEEPFLGTIPRYCTAYLQRLANPLMPFDAVTNPYRTVDAMPIDLTVFSGEERESAITDDGPAQEYARRSRQRNGHVDGVPRDVLFSYETNEEDLTPLAPLPDPAPVDPDPLVAYFSFPADASGGTHVYSSLNFLNTVFPVPAEAGVAVNPAPFTGFSASIGMSGTLAAGANVFDRNVPIVPYAHHPWLNRPFASHLELMMVPASSQGRLFLEFSPLQFTSPTEEVGGYFEYEEDNGSATAIAKATQQFQGPFRHLLNFFHGDFDADTDLSRAEFARIFDFVHTLPRYRGEIEMIRPTRIAAVNNSTAPGETRGTRDWMLEMFSSPFNYRYNNQRQGRINFNTIGEFQVWAGLMQGHMNNEEFTDRNSALQLGFNQFLNNRRGFTPPSTGPVVIGDHSTDEPINFDPSRFDSRLPTQFAGAYREHLDSAYAPSVRDDADILRRRGVDASVLRRRDAIADPPLSTEVAMYVRPTDTPPNPSTLPPPPPGLTGPVGNHTSNRERNAFIRYQTVMRMPNLASDNSQTYLVRLTLGLFEVDATSGSLGREYNEDIGQNERYRAMFIIDRSRPVGFIPGQDLNARDVVIFEKYFQ